MDLINKFYLSSIIISIIIFYLLLSDTKRITFRIYQEINDEIWLKLYAFIMIAVVHLIWAFAVIFLNYNDKSVVYGFPVILLVPYVIYLVGEFYGGMNEESETNLSIKVNMWMNCLMSIYIIAIIILVLMPNKYKTMVVQWIKAIIQRITKIIIV